MLVAILGFMLGIAICFGGPIGLIIFALRRSAYARKESERRQLQKEASTPVRIMRGRYRDAGSNAHLKRLVERFQEYWTEKCHYAPRPDGSLILRLGPQPLKPIQDRYHSHDQRNTAEVVKFQDKYQVTVQNHQADGFDEIGEFVFSPDGRRFAYSARRKAKWWKFLVAEWVVVIDGVETQAYQKVGWSTFSPNSRRFAFFAELDGTFAEVCVVDGAPTPPCGRFGGLMFSQDSCHVAAWSFAHQGGVIILNGTSVTHDCNLITSIRFDDNISLDRNRTK